MNGLSHLGGLISLPGRNRQENTVVIFITVYNSIQKQVEISSIDEIKYKTLNFAIS